MARKVRVGFDDSCAGVEVGGRNYKVKGGTVEMAAADAQRLRESGFPTASAASRVGVGWSPQYEAAWERIFGDREGGDAG